MQALWVTKLGDYVYAMGISKTEGVTYVQFSISPPSYSPLSSRRSVCLLEWSEARHYILVFLLTPSFDIGAQASLHFCSECNNLLYPKADQQRRIMVYACRICPYDEIGDNKCVYRNDLLTVTK